jgi:hypothetical protein
MSCVRVLAAETKDPTMDAANYMIFETKRGDIGWLAEVNDGATWLQFELRGGFDNRVFSLTRERWQKVRPHPHLVADSELVEAAIHALALNDAFTAPDHVVKPRLAPKVYHPRMWRGRFSGGLLVDYNPVDPEEECRNEYCRATLAAHSIYDRLDELALYIEPTLANMKTYGHRLREILIITCTEIEAAWKSILRANNGLKAGKSTTNDYVRLLEPMRLADWSVRLSAYPEAPVFRPFGGWRIDAPSQSLPWYEAYHAVKHDRDGQFDAASLHNALSSVAALHVMNCAQWGPTTFSAFHGGKQAPFEIDSLPAWPLDELYYGVARGDQWMQVPFFGG